MIGRILVPLDQSAFAEQALLRAMELARRAGAILRLVSVSAPAAPFGSEWLPAPLAGMGDRVHLDRIRYLEEMSGWARRASGLPVETAVLTGFVADTIREDARASHVDLIVMSTHGRTGSTCRWIGSVADAVVRHGERPVFLVHAQRTAQAEPTRTLPRSVLVPLSGTAAGECVLEPMLDLVESAARCELLHVVGTDVREDDPVWRERHAALEMIADRLSRQRPELQLTVRVARDEFPARAIVGAAGAVDLVAIATRGHGPSRVVLGSVTDALLRGTSADVLVMRQDPDAAAHEPEHSAELAGAAG
ncbi:MAG TPA: universal stress protein [Gemmatimonadaceae bacterium]|nr:universal stress protein [Gemmatimonadaceae bacterium]